MYADLITLAFARQHLVWVFVDVNYLDDCGFPPHVLGKAKLEAGGIVPLAFDFSNVTVREGMGIECHDEQITTNLSFDALYSVVIPYTAIRQIRFQFVPGASIDDDEGDAPPVREPKVRRLSLVVDNSTAEADDIEDAPPVRVPKFEARKRRKPAKRHVVIIDDLDDGKDG